MSRMEKVIADVVYINGNIYTMDSCVPKATCLAIKGDRLVYVGGKVQAEFFIGKDTKVVDLKGKAVYPGFNEAHMHLYDYTKVLLSVDIYCKTKEEILKNVKMKVEAAEPGEWIWGMGWSELFWKEKTYPTKEDLDQVAPDNPVVLERFGGHMSWVNSKALELAGIDENVKNPQGGEYLRNESGKLTGCLTETARDPIESIIPPLSGKQLKDGLQMTQKELLACILIRLRSFRQCRKFEQMEAK